VTREFLRPEVISSSSRGPVVVGRDGASLTPEQARDAVFGYRILNDWSTRDLQRREMPRHLHRVHRRCAPRRRRRTHPGAVPRRARRERPPDPLEYAHRSYEQAVNSPQRELRIFTPEEGGAEHIGLDHLPDVSAFIADWVADTFAATPVPRSRPIRALNQ
jgi:hypothetical protein